MNTGRSDQADSKPYLVIDDHAMRAALFARFLKQERNRDTFIVPDANGAREMTSDGRRFGAALFVVGGIRLTHAKAVADHIAEAVSLGWPLAVVADDGDASDAQQALALGANGYITTDLTEGVFLAALSVVVAGGSFVSPHCMLGLADTGALKEALTNKSSNGTLSNDLLHPSMQNLSPRQHDVLRLVSLGRLNKEIAHHLGMTEGTVKAHVRGILRKLAVANRTQAAHLYLQAASDEGASDALKAPRRRNGDTEVRRILC